jgi:hypothetical protein
MIKSRDGVERNLKASDITNMKHTSTLPDGVEIKGPMDAQTAQILSP